MEWAAQFYKQQFYLSKADFEGIPQSFYLKEVENITEQFGKPFFRVLVELGAGTGNLANALANQQKDVTSVELVEELTAFAKKTSTAPHTILCGDFYQIN